MDDASKEREAEVGRELPLVGVCFGSIAVLENRQQWAKSGHSRNTVHFPANPFTLRCCPWESDLRNLAHADLSPLLQRLDVLLSKGISLSEDPRHFSGVPGSPTA
jgi:hypothetical protein